MITLYSKKTALSFLLALTFFVFVKAQNSSVYFDLDACNATITTGDNMDYSEFTGVIQNSACANLNVVGGHLYRNNPAMNKHSCTPGVDGDVAMCISSNPSCSFTANSNQALRIDILVTPGSTGSANFSELSFYEKGPVVYDWINGPSGPNNYPTLFGIRIVKNGVQVFLSTGIPTELEWNLNTFNFSGPEFTVTTPTTFNIELLPYCPVGNGASVSAWDIDEIRITANCCDVPSGGQLSGGPFAFCMGDGIPDFISGIVLNGQTGSNSQFVITDAFGNILNLPDSLESVDFEGSGSGTQFIYNISFLDGLTGLEVGNNLLNSLSGCFGLSNAITIVITEPDGGTLSGGPFEFCVGDGNPDYVTGIELTGNVGEQSQWVVTTDDATILGLPNSPEDVDFDGAPPGVCLIWNISYNDTISGLEIGNDLFSVSGCLGFSNPISVVRNQPEGGELSGGPFDFCVGDNIADFISGLELLNNVGDTSQFVLTNEETIIISIPGTLDTMDFDNLDPQTILLWNISSFGSVSGIEIGNDLFTEVEGCISISNPITINLNQPEGGELIGGPFEFCVGDSIPDFVSGVVLTGNVGTTSQWVVTNENNTILSLPASLDSVNFDGAGTGICLIWNISYYDTISGLVPGNNLPASVTGCFDLSNSITVIRNQPEGGLLTGGPFEFCVGDSIPDHVSGILLSGNSGTTGQWVITNENNVILSLPNNPEDVNFDNSTPGICLIWHVSYFYTISGLVPGNNLLNNLTGCFAISNPITVVRNQPSGGIFTGGPFAFCQGDSLMDFTGLILSGNVGGNNQLIITNDVNTIVGLPGSIEEISFDGNGTGTFFIYNISFFDTLSGLGLENNLANVTGCFGLSNAITVVITQPDGGTLSGGPFEFCIGDGIPDHVLGIVLTGNEGEHSQWVVTTDDATILGMPNSPEDVDFDGALPGVCLIWNISYYDTITGLEIGKDLFSVIGCLGFSNPISVVRNQPEGGELFGGPFDFCVGDSIADFISGLELLNNVGDNSQLILTNEETIIIGIPGTLDTIDFDNMDPQTILVWNVSSFDSIGGIEIGNDLFTDVEGCFSISNPITINLNQPEGGELIGGPFDFCVGDSISDFVSGVELAGNFGGNSQFVVTDSFYTILNLVDAPEDADFNDASPGTWYIFHVSYDGTLTGLEIGNNLFTELEGCFSISNAITVVATDCNSVQNGDPAFKLKISPNPVSDLLTLEMLNAGIEKPIVEILDASGRVCFKQRYEGTNMKINMNHFAEGCYFVRVQNLRGYRTETIVVVK